MKNQSGITLMSLIIYVLVMLIVVTTVGSITVYFYNNVITQNESAAYGEEFNKFNMFFVEEVKKVGNKIEIIDETNGKYIKFTSGNQYTFQDNCIYMNSVKIAQNVKDAIFRKDVNNENTIQVFMTIGKQYEVTTTLDYVLEQKEEPIVVDNKDYISITQKIDWSILPEYNEIKKVNNPKGVKGMVPVVWNTTYNNWQVTVPNDTAWFDYGNKKWANIMLQDGLTYNEDTGEVLTPGSMFVWIPKYTYSKNNQPYFYNFIFQKGTVPTGIWVAKYETSIISKKIKVVPNATALTNLSIKEMFDLSQNMILKDKEFYGISGTQVDSHMMKNTEWGAIAYLSQTNNNEMIGSSSGNEYGIYNMNGGVAEYTMAVLNNNLGASGFTVLPDAKYYDNYTGYNTTLNGDAVYETSTASTGSTSWYGDYSEFITTVNPWMVRGGSSTDGTNAGIFAFQAGDGGANSNIGFRVVLTI